MRGIFRHLEEVRQKKHKHEPEREREGDQQQCDDQVGVEYLPRSFCFAFCEPDGDVARHGDVQGLGQ